MKFRNIDDHLTDVSSMCDSLFINSGCQKQAGNILMNKIQIIYNISCFENFIVQLGFGNGPGISKMYLSHNNSVLEKNSVRIFIKIFILNHCFNAEEKFG